ncbi:alpha/beta fold hydrolase [Chachezhania sediminis]|uniref:alpha/beta fold hydrolase n=1 Tax=Chachezhania sediminis TaxID=2599291 RepID=UPI00131C1564|nr:alpha/beta fold hydrolase [Chachezhania sediminis]
MTDILLIHGACHGAWCWADLIPELEALGHAARAIDLPGMGADRTSISDITLASTAQAVVDAATPDTLVVGHSWGGMVIGEAAGMAPGGMAGLVLLAAYVPQPGLSLKNLRDLSPWPASAAKLIVSEDRRSVSFPREAAAGLFYGTCRPSAREYALDRLCPQPASPQSEPATLGAGWDATPKHFIMTLQDRTIVTDYQRQMVADWPAGTVHDIDTDHSPFLSDPAGLAAILDRIARGLD